MARTEVRGGQILDASVSLTADVTGTLPVANGGTGAASQTLNYVLLGNGTGALQNVAPGASGNVLTSNGTTWASALPNAVRVNTTASSATPAINTDTTDQFNITALAANITSMTSSLTGTPVDGQKLLIRITGTAARTITWGTSFASSGTATLLATTATTKTHMIGLIYDSVVAKFVCVAVDSVGY